MRSANVMSTFEKPELLRGLDILRTLKEDSFIDFVEHEH